MRQPQMRYQAIMASSTSEMGPPGLKIETPDHEFQGDNLRTSPVYMQHLNSPHTAPGMAQPDPGPYTVHTIDRFHGQYFPSHGFMPTETMHHFGHVPVMMHEGEVSAMAPNQKPTPTRRGPFKDQRTREETAATRKMGSCIRCRMQRIRVSVTPAGSGDTCLFNADGPTMFLV